MTTYGYTRKSTTDDRQKNSHEVQRAAIQTWADGRTVVFHEEDGSASRRGKLPERDRLVGSLREDDVLVAAKLDRLARSTIDLGHVIDRAQRRGFKVVVLDVPGLDMTTPAGEMVATVLVAMGRFESRRIGERISETMQHLKTEGRKFGRPRLIPAKVRRRILDLHADGLGKRAIATQLNEAGIPTVTKGARWHPGTVQRVLEQEGAA